MYKLDSNNVEDLLPLTPMQTIMLLTYLNNPYSRQYKEQTRYKLTGDINVEHLKAALKFVTNSNELLRTVYRWEGLGSPVQIILKEFDVPIQEYDLSGYLKEEGQKLAAEIEKEDLSEKMDIRLNPLRFILCKLSNTEFYLIVSNHHIIFDGWSNGILLKELVEAYETYSCGFEPVPQPKGKYKEFIKLLLKQDREKQRAFWKKYLADFRGKTPLPLDKFQEKGSGEEGLFESMLEENLCQNIRSYSRKMEVTVASILYTAWGILQHKHSGLEDILFGTTLSGRPPEIKNIQNTIGLFINTIPFRVKILPNMNVNSLIFKVNELFAEVGEYQYTSMTDIIYDSNNNQQEGLYDSVVVVQNYPMDERLLAQDRMMKISLYSRSIMTGMKLTLGVRIFNGIALDVTYNKTFFRKDDIAKIVEQLIRILEEIVNNENISLAQEKCLKVEEISIMCTEEREKMEVILEKNKNSLKLIEEVDFDEIF